MMRKACSVLLFAQVGITAFAGPRDAQWQQVAEAEKKGRPKTAIQLVEPIIKGALQEKAYGEAVKAIAKKIKLEGDVQGRKAEEKIVRLQEEAEKAPREIKPVLETILAHWYWHFFQQNRWRFMQRTRTGQASGEDILTWDLPRILAEVDKHFAAALGHEAALRKIPVAEYGEVLAKGSAPDTYRPTLYDFIAHEALEFYSTGEQAGAKAQDAFDLSAESPVFDAAAGFMKWQIQTADEGSRTVKALRLYQELMSFHADDGDLSAFIDADLLRLNFGYNEAFGEEKNERYKAALKRFVAEHADHRISARALHMWATVLQSEGDLVEAHRLATRGARMFPDTPGGNRCHNLVQSIQSKTLSLHTERVWNEPWPDIRLKYRNLTKVHFRVVQFDWQQLLQRKSWNPEYFGSREKQQLLGREPVKAWSEELPPTPDYQVREEVLPVPRGLQPGFYFLISSAKPGFGETENQVNYTGFWVSDLALVIRTRRGSGQVEGFVLAASSGEPVAGAQIRTWYRERDSRAVPGPGARTDANGLFSFRTSGWRGYTILASHQGRQISSQQQYSDRASDMRPKPYTRTMFFTDRSLYRPGQTIRYKGLCIRVDQEKDDYQVMPGQNIIAILRDVNGKEITRQTHRCNDYGSFTGSVTAPRDRLMGRMSIQTEGEPRGSAYINVEEYKRPKFRVALEAPTVAARLDGNVAIKGQATSYTGAPVDGAQVRYRVAREVRYPVWWRWYCWWHPPQRGSSQEISHGSATTGTDGSFEVSFRAVPDRSVAESDEPTFRYTVYADVTDGAGETRSGQRVVNVGYTALQASLSAGEWQEKQKPVEIGVGTRTLDGEGQPAEGTLTVYRLKEPATVQRGNAPGYRPYVPRYRRGGKRLEPPVDPANPNSWALAEAVTNISVETSAEGTAGVSVTLPPGLYRAMLETQDRFKKKVTARLPLQILDAGAGKCGLKIPFVVAAPKWSLEPGESLGAVWGTGYDKGMAFVEIEHRGRNVRSFWTDPEITQTVVEQSVSEAMRGGFTLHVTMVRENRAYLTSRRVNVPWSNKRLQLKWEHFTSKLEPGQKETWTAVITGPKAEKAAAEMVAALYDESLDAYKPHRWTQAFGVFRHDSSRLSSQFQSSLRQLGHLCGNWPVRTKNGSLTYRTFPQDVTAHYVLWGRRGGRGGGAGRRRAGRGLDATALAAAPPATMARKAFAKNAPAEDESVAVEENRAANFRDAKRGNVAGGEAPAPGPDLSRVTARKNLQETAFFFPRLVAGPDGKVKMEFTMPEALTQWKFMGFAHDVKLRSGYMQDSAVTAKDIMVQPNPPRFLREGDVLEFTVKVVNQSPTRQQGLVQLTLADARTMKSVNRDLKSGITDLKFDIPTKESRTYSWRLDVPDGLGFLTYKAVAATRKLSDGEAGYLPVLPRRILVTESLPLPIRKPITKQFDFAKLRASGKSDTLRHQSLTVQMVSNPSWYAIMALPYLIESRHECSERVFNRLYANSLARHIAMSDPKVRRVFDLWKGTKALDSPLEKNEELKAVMLEETPWVRQAQAESEARKNVGILFDRNRLDRETERIQRKLAQMQRGDGAWPWFPGGQPSDYITLYITTGFGRMRHLGIKGIDMGPAVKSLNRLDGWINGIYRDILRYGREGDNNLTSTIALYLYGRSFFLEDQPIKAGSREAVDYFLGQAKKYWLQLPRQSQAHLAVAVQRFGRDQQTPKDIMISLKEYSVSDDELGMFWRDTEYSWWWYRAPIETQAMMIEAFDEVAKDADAVEECKVWLLKQKQTQDWKTTKATADAVYALLLRGVDLLASDELVQVKLADMQIEPEQVEAGTGFYEKRFVGPEIKPEYGRVTVKKVDEGVAWGSLHWQYFEDMSKITPHEGTPLKLRKALYTKVNTKKGPVLKPVRGALKVGDELVVRIGLRVDRDMEYVHMKDQRGSGTEPVNVLSKYKYQDGLYYYESTRDTASHFFIDYLPKGTYVFEYSTRVQHKGQYQSGMALIECMYAPEFNSHSESFALTAE